MSCHYVGNLSQQDSLLAGRQGVVLSMSFPPQGVLGLMQSGLGEGAPQCGTVSRTLNASMAQSSCPLAVVAPSHGQKGPSLAHFTTC